MFLRSVVLSLSFAVLLGTALTAQPVRLARDFDGVSAEVEVRDLSIEEARAAAEEALNAVWRVHVMVFGDVEGTVGALQSAPGETLVVLHEELARELQRALALCVWSGGAWGPLSGGINKLWRGLAPAPQPSELREAVGNTACARLELKPGEPPQASLAAGSIVDLRGIQRGWAVDEAMRVLQQRGVRNAAVAIGNVVRAIGDGPEGKGWPITLPAAGGATEPMDAFWLRDMAVAFHTTELMRGRPIVDQRTGAPARGVAGIAVVGNLGADSEGLATALWVLGHRKGHLRLGALKPRPSVLFLLGDGEGMPVESSYGWYDKLERPRPPKTR